jgi:hypothetical protein
MFLKNPPCRSHDLMVAFPPFEGIRQGSRTSFSTRSSFILISATYQAGLWLSDAIVIDWTLFGSLDVESRWKKGGSNQARSNIGADLPL